MLYGILAVVYGTLMSIQTMLCATLTANYGNWFSTVTVHLSGLIALLPFSFTRWGRRKGSAPWYLYLGGTLGLINVVMTNYSVIRIGLTACNVLMLLGEIVFSTLLDSLGLFGTKKRRVSALKWCAIAVMLLGCGAIFVLSGESGTAFALGAFIAAFFRGVTLVISRQLNGQLGVRAGTGYSTWMNYVTGFVGALVIFAVLSMPMETAFPAPKVPFWAYLCGAIGCCGIFLCNLSSPKLSVLTMSLLVFISETAAGLLFDLAIGRLNVPIVVGCAIVSIGMVINLFAERKE